MSAPDTTTPPATHSASQQALAEVRDRIDVALHEAGRGAEQVELVAIGKTFGASKIMPVLEARHKIFGENRIQEAMKKWPALKEQYPDTELHLIGPLQSNKAGDAVRLFDVIETVDRPKIARVLAQEMARQDKKLTLFVQVNTGGEPQKSGILPQDADQFIADCRGEIGIEIAGLMCIPPVDEEPSLHFALLAKIAERNNIKLLSMGMSSDFETAIAFGATHVRVGSAIFGERTQVMA